MNILVTGGAGYIGSHFCKTAKKHGLTPVVLDDLSTGHEKFVKFGPFVNANVLETEKVVQTLGDYKIQAVFHFAGKALVGESVSQSDLYFKVNRDGTESLLKAMNTANVKKFIFSSSCATYGVSEKNLSESHAQCPINPYGESKLSAERIAIEFQNQFDFQVSLLRYFNVIGSDPDGELWEDHEPETHIIPNLIKAFVNKKAFQILGNQHPTKDGTCVRDYVDVNDLANVHIEALKQLGRKPFISNVGIGIGCSVLEVLHKFENVFGKVKCEISDPRKGDPPYLVADAKYFKTWYKKNLRDMTSTLENMKKTLKHDLSI